MKFVLMIYLFYQNGLAHELASTINAGRFEESECWARATTETKTLPLQPGNHARWQYATCVRIES